VLLRPAVGYTINLNRVDVNAIFGNHSELESDIRYMITMSNYDQLSSSLLSNVNYVET
jgi:hypothetical protein